MKCQSQKDKYHIISLYLESKIVKFTEAETCMLTAGGCGGGEKESGCSMAIKFQLCKRSEF